MPDPLEKTPEEKAAIDAADAAKTAEKTADDPAAKLQTELDSARAELAELAGLKQNVADLFTTDATGEQRLESLASVMIAGGMSKDDARTILEELVVNKDETLDAKEGEKKDEKGAGEKEKPDPTAEEIKGLKERLQKMEGETATAKQTAAQDLLVKSVADSVEGNAAMQTVLATMKTIKGEDHAKKVLEIVKRDVLREAMEGLYARNKQLGFFDRRWISEEAQKAVTSTVEKVKTLGAVGTVGKTPAADEMALMAELSKADVKSPTFDPKKDSVGVGMDAVSDFTTNKLKQIAAKANTGGGSKA